MGRLDDSGEPQLALWHELAVAWAEVAYSTYYPRRESTTSGALTVSYGRCAGVVRSRLEVVRRMSSVSTNYETTVYPNTAEKHTVSQDEGPKTKEEFM